MRSRRRVRRRTFVGRKRALSAPTTRVSGRARCAFAPARTCWRAKTFRARARVPPARGAPCRRRCARRCSRTKTFAGARVHARGCSGRACSAHARGPLSKMFARGCECDRASARERGRGLTNARDHGAPPTARSRTSRCERIGRGCIIPPRFIRGSARPGASMDGCRDVTSRNLVAARTSARRVGERIGGGHCNSSAFVRQRRRQGRRRLLGHGGPERNDTSRSLQMDTVHRRRTKALVAFDRDFRRERRTGKHARVRFVRCGFIRALARGLLHPDAP